MKALLLAGGGHAHIEVLRRLRRGSAATRAATLVNPSRWFVYSGMVPGVIAGHYPLEACRIDLVDCCARAGVRFVEARITRLDLEAGVAHLDSGRPLHFDVLSLDTGSSPDGEAIAGARAHGLPVRPLGPLVERWRAWLAAWIHDPRRPGLVVIGGGAGGAELAMAAAHGMHRLDTAPARRRGVTLVTEHLVPSHDDSVRRRVTRALQRLGVDIVPRRVVTVTAQGVLCESGEPIPASLVVYATGATGASWARASGLKTDDAGCVLVDRTLRALSHPAVFAAGDVATMAAQPLPKAGVFAVRQGKVLAANLDAALTGGPLRRYVPQQRWLSLISLGERRAVGSYGPLTWEGDWVWRWKDVIDRRFVSGS